MKAKWIPAERIVELQSPAVSPASTTTTTTTQSGVLKNKYLSCVLSPFDDFIFFAGAGEVLADDGLLCQRQAAPAA